MNSSARRESVATGPSDPAERAREIALRLLNHSPRSAGQLRSKLLAKDIEPHVVDEVIERYREVGLLDDAALAATIVRTRYHERGQARRAIAQELKRKEFEPEDIEAALEQLSAEDEHAAARELAAKRWDRLAGLDTEVKTRRVVGMLGRKGYSPSVAFAVVKDLQRADTEGA